MHSTEHEVVKSGEFYLTWLGGYSTDIDNAGWVKHDVKLIGRQRLVKVRSITTIEEVK